MIRMLMVIMAFRYFIGVFLAICLLKHDSASRIVISADDCVDRRVTSESGIDAPRMIDADAQKMVDMLYLAEFNAKTKRIEELKHQLAMANLENDQTSQVLSLNGYLQYVPIPEYRVPKHGCCNYIYADNAIYDMHTGGRK